MHSESETAAERLLLAFQERYFADEADDSVGSLAHYLALWPDHQELIAREYLALSRGEGSRDGEEDGDRREDRLGPYRLEAEIGRGGQGLVHRAIDTRLGRTVALKVLTGLGPGAERQLARFKREAEVAARLEHPGICGVHEAGILNGVPYIAMRYVRGETLGQRISRTRGESLDGPATTSFLELSDADGRDDSAAAAPSRDAIAARPVMPRSQLDAILLVFEKAARALHAAHAAGIVHRDIKPGNIMISEAGEPVILDFGLASDEADDSLSLTMTGDLFGTPAYMSPEQIAGQRIALDARSDVYSLGVTLYEALTLRRPFEAPTREGLYQAIMTKEAPDPRRLNRSISKDLKVVLECALEKDRDRRYSSALDLAEDLAALRESRPIKAIPIGRAGRAWRWARRRPMKAALFAVLAIGIPLVTGLGGFIWANLDDIAARREAKRIERREEILERAFLLLAGAQYDLAREAFEEARDVDPRSDETLVGVALLDLKERGGEAALKEVRRVESRVADRDALRRVEIAALHRLGRQPEAESVQARTSRPDASLDWFIEAIVDWKEPPPPDSMTASDREEWGVVVGGLKRAIHAAPQARRVLHLLLADAAARARDRDAARVNADALEALWPDWPDSWNHIARSVMEFDPERALTAVDRALGMDGGAYSYLATRARVLHRLGRDGEVRRMIHQAARGELGTERTSDFDFMTLAVELDECDAALELGRRSLIDLTGTRRAVVLNAIGNVRRMRGEFDAALANYEEAVPLMPAVAVMPANIAQVLCDAGRAEEGLVWADRAIATDATAFVSHLARAACLHALGRDEEALAATDVALQCSRGSFFGLTRAAIRLESLGRADRAVEAYEAALELAPGHVNTIGCLAHALFTCRRFEEAAATAERGIARQDELPEPPPLAANMHVLLIGSLLELPTKDRALAALERARRLFPDDHHVRQISVSCFEKLGRLPDALAAARRSSEFRPDDADARVALARLISGTGGDDGEALSQAEKACELDPGHAEARTLRGRLLMNLDRKEEAEEALREAIRLDANRAEAHRLLGVLLAGFRRNAEALEAFERALALAPDDLDNHENMARILSELGREEESRARWKEAMRRFPAAASPVIGLIKAEVRAQNLAALESLSRRVLEIDPENPDGHLYAGVAAFWSRGDRRAFEESLFRSYELHRARSAPAERIARAAQALAPTLRLRLQDLLDEGELDEANELLDARLVAVPELEREGALLGLIPAWEALDPDRRLELAVSRAFGEAQRARERGRPRAAMPFLERITRLRPGDPRAHNLLAWYRVDPDGDPALRDPAAALPHARKAVQASDRRNASYLDTLATTLFALGDLKEAVSTQEEILRLMDGKDAGDYTLDRARALLERYRAALASSELSN
ncbi:MAG: tetratricopeptide repeat protein [Planctomycetota bacterium]